MGKGQVGCVCLQEGQDGEADSVDECVKTGFGGTVLKAVEYKSLHFSGVGRSVVQCCEK